MDDYDGAQPRCRDDPSGLVADSRRLRSGHGRRNYAGRGLVRDVVPVLLAALVHALHFRTRPIAPSIEWLAWATKLPPRSASTSAAPGSRRESSISKSGRSRRDRIKGRRRSASAEVLAAVGGSPTNPKVDASITAWGGSLSAIVSAVDASVKAANVYRSDRLRRRVLGGTEARSTTPMADVAGVARCASGPRRAAGTGAPCSRRSAHRDRLPP